MINNFHMTMFKRGQQRMTYACAQAHEYSSKSAYIYIPVFKNQQLQMKKKQLKAKINNQIMIVSIEIYKKYKLFDKSSVVYRTYITSNQYYG